MNTQTASFAIVLKNFTEVVSWVGLSRGLFNTVEEAQQNGKEVNAFVRDEVTNVRYINPSTSLEEFAEIHCLPNDPKLTLKNFDEFLNTERLLITRIQIQSQQQDNFNQFLKVEKMLPHLTMGDHRLYLGQYQSDLTVTQNRLIVDLIGEGLELAIDPNTLLTLSIAPNSELILYLEVSSDTRTNRY